MAYEEERKKAFVVFASTYEAAVSHLTLEQMGELFVKMGKYSLAGEDVRSDNPMVDVILKMTIPNLDAAERRHQAAVKNGFKGKEYGNTGGRPRKGESREEYDARRLEKARSVEDGSENPEKPLNRNTNTDIKTNIEIDEEIKKETDIKKKTDINKNTNVEIISNSVLANNLLSSNLKPSLDTTRTGEKPGAGTRPQQKDLSDSSNLEDETKHVEEPGPDERARLAGNNGSKGSDFIRSITLADQDDDAPLTPPSDQYRNYVGRLEDFLRYDAEPDYDGMTDADMMDAIKRDIDAAITCERREGTSQRYRDHIHRAKRIYMHLNGCDEDSAKRSITRLYREREKEF